MIKRYILPAVTADGQDTSICIVVDDYAKLREWLYNVRCHIAVSRFSFYWAQDPRASRFPLIGSFCWAYRMDGIYIKMRLCYEDYYRDVLYPLDDLWRMLYKSERPSLGWCITVKVC